IASNCSGELGAGIEPNVVSFSIMSGVFRTWPTSRLTWARIAGGVRAGASRAHQDSYLYSGKAASACGGTFGSWGARLAELMAIARTLPASLSSFALGMGAKYIWTSPRITALVASGTPL